MNNISKKTIDPFLVSPFDRSLPVDWSQEGLRSSRLHVEIGFGTGEYLVRCAQQNPQDLFVGVELEAALITKALKRVKRNKLSNVRLIKMDARIAMERLFAQRSIQNIQCLFPFPWPKKRHHKKRLFDHQFLKLVNSRLVNKGTLTLITDFKPYIEWITDQTRGTGFTVADQEISAQFDTKFERKWSSEGQKLFFKLTLTKIKHLSQPNPTTVKIQPLVVKRFDPQRYSPHDHKGQHIIIFKKFFYDPTTRQGQQHLLIIEGTLAQQIRVLIRPNERSWTLSIDPNNKIFQTPGIIKGLLLIKKAMKG